MPAIFVVWLFVRFSRSLMGLAAHEQTDNVINVQGLCITSRTVIFAPFENNDDGDGDGRPRPCTINSTNCPRTEVGRQDAAASALRAVVK